MSESLLTEAPLGVNDHPDTVFGDEDEAFSAGAFFSLMELLTEYPAER